MKLTTQQMQRIVDRVFKSWKSQNVVIFKEDEKKCFQKAFEYLQKDLQREQDLEKEVFKMLDELERSNPGSFQRHKMFPMLKQKLAKERKIIL
jgi:hypothetical protein